MRQLENQAASCGVCQWRTFYVAGRAVVASEARTGQDLEDVRRRRRAVVVDVPRTLSLSCMLCGPREQPPSGERAIVTARAPQRNLYVYHWRQVQRAVHGRSRCDVAHPRAYTLDDVFSLKRAYTM